MSKIASISLTLNVGSDNNKKIQQFHECGNRQIIRMITYLIILMARLLTSRMNGSISSRVRLQLSTMIANTPLYIDDQTV